MSTLLRFELLDMRVWLWHLVSRLLGIETFLIFLRVSLSVSKNLVSKKRIRNYVGFAALWTPGHCHWGHNVLWVTQKYVGFARPWAPTICGECWHFGNARKMLREEIEIPERVQVGNNSHKEFTWIVSLRDHNWQRRFISICRRLTWVNRGCHVVS